MSNSKDSEREKGEKKEATFQWLSKEGSKGTLPKLLYQLSLGLSLKGQKVRKKDKVKVTRSDFIKV